MSKGNYAILITEKIKRKSKKLREITDHVDRTSKKSAANAAFNLRFKNKHYEGIQREWVNVSVDLVYAINYIIDKKGIKEKKDNVIVQQFILTAANEFFNPNGCQYGQWDDKILQKWLDKNILFLTNKYGEFFIKAELHLDEATPHFHAFIMPALYKVIKKRRTKKQIADKVKCQTYKKCTFDARTLFSKKSLSDLQTEYALEMKEFGLKRGLKGSKAKHLKIKKFYEDVNLPVPKLPEPFKLHEPNKLDWLNPKRFLNKLSYQVANYYKEFEEKLQKYYRIIINQRRKIQQLEDRISWYAEAGTPDEWQEKMQQKIDDKNRLILEKNAMDEELDELESMLKNGNTQLYSSIEEIKELKDEVKILKKDKHVREMSKLKELFSKQQLDESELS